MRILFFALTIGVLCQPGCTCRAPGPSGECQTFEPVPDSDVPGGPEGKEWPPTVKVPLPAKSAREDSVSTEPARAQMRSALRALALAQDEIHRVEQQYSDRLAYVLAKVEGEMPRDVYLRIVSAGREGWSARAEHILLPARTCVLWVGRPGYPPSIVTAFEQRPGERFPGQPVCDGDPLR